MKDPMLFKKVSFFVILGCVFCGLIMKIDRYLVNLRVCNFMSYFD